MKKVIFLFTVLFILNLNASSDQCLDLFKSTRVSTLFTEKEIDEIVNSGDAHSRKSVRSEGVVETSEGSAVRLVRFGPYWSSAFKGSDLANEGNPLIAISILGPKLARIFGYRKISNTEILVPTPEKINLVLKKINALLKKKGLEPIPFNFYDDSRPSTPLQELLERFASSMSFPLTTNTDISVHDYSYHVLAFLIPNKVLEYARGQSLATMKLIEFLEKKRSSIRDDENLNKLIEKLILIRVTSTDVGTGNTTPLLLADKFHIQDVFEPVLRSNFSYLVSDGSSFKEYIEDLIEIALSRRVTVFIDSVKNFNGEKEFRKTIVDLLKEFLATTNVPAIEKPLSNADGSKYTHIHYISDLRQRLKDLRSLFP